MEGAGGPHIDEQVLILEDESSQRKTLTALLEEEGFHILACSRGAEALEALVHGKVVVAIVDLHLPDLSTGYLLNALVKWSDRIPIIVYTAFGSYESARDAVNVGAFAYVEKAGPPEELLRQVHRALHSRMRRYAEELEQAVHARTRELEEANTALRESEERLRLAKNSAGLGIYDHDVVHDRIQWDDRVREIWGVGLQEPINYSVFMAGLHPEDRSPTQAALDLAFDPSGKGEYIAEYRVINLADGCERWVVATGQVAFDKGRPVRNVGTVQDITERKRAEQKILHYQRQLKAMTSELTLSEERLRRDVASHIHDEISQCLAMSKVRIETLCEALPDDSLRAELAGIVGSLDQTLRDARTLTAQLSYPSLNVLGLGKAVETWLSEEVKAKHGIETVFYDDMADKPLDEDMQAILFRSVREMLTNVVKHAHATRVAVSMQQKADQMVVVIEDNGVGGAPEERLSKSLGFGLLSIRESLERLGGTLVIKSPRGAGCKITVKAPLKLEVPLESEVPTR